MGDGTYIVPAEDVPAVLAAFRDSAGILKNVAETLGWDRPRVEAAVREHPEVARALDSERAKADDLFLERLLEQVALGNVGAMQLWHRLRKERSYPEEVVRALVRELYQMARPHIDEGALSEVEDAWLAIMTRHLRRDEAS